jgi:uncharacterized membrane protein YjfL (UPF0719 family)
MSNPANIANFLLYFVTSVVLLSAFLAAYTLVTDIRNGACSGPAIPR